MLELEGLTKSFGGLAVVRDTSFMVQRGEIVGLIGPNGAGKTTVFNLIAGALAPDAGHVRFEGRDITGWSPEDVARAGLVRTFQVPRLFEDLSVVENLLVAAPAQSGETFWKVWLRPGLIGREETAIEERAWETLELLGLARHANSLATQLSGGQKKLLELGRALMVGPSLVLLDEPVAGVSPTLMVEIGDRLATLRKRGLTLLIVEHKMDFIMGLSDRLYVMAMGSVLAHGTPAEIRANQAVLDAYLGVA